MSNTRPLSEYSRQQLYDLIWSTPAIKLAGQFGISDVAIAKRCKTQNVPRPLPGYWAKVAAGNTPKKPPLPPTHDEVFKQEMQWRVRKTLPLPSETEPLLPLAAELVSMISKGQLDSFKRAHFRERTLPEVTVSKSLATRVGKAFHTILSNVESVGIAFRKSRSSYNGGYFERRHDRLYLTIVEDVMHRDGTRESSGWWQSPRGDERPSGYLTFSLNPNRYGSREVKEWSESAKLPLEKALAQLVAAIRSHFAEAQERREREAIQRAKEQAEWLQRRQEWERQEAIRLEEEKKRMHVEAVNAAVLARLSALSKAADIELDPASSSAANARIGAARYFTEEINGLAQPWVTPSLWMNHPYGKSEQKCAANCQKKICAKRGFHSEAFKPGNAEWINKLVQEYECGNVKEACCITFASTSERWFRPLLKQPQCFLFGRISFILPNGEPLRGNTKGSVVSYFGRNVAEFAAEFEHLGQIKVPYGF